MESRTALAAVAVIVAVSAAYVVIRANRRWTVETERVRQRLSTAHAVHNPACATDSLTALPAPVQRYLEMALAKGQPMVTHTRITSTGTFNMGEPPASAWKVFTATQDFYPGAPGFVWDARVRMAPGIHAYVRDAFIDGTGSMFASVLGIVTVANSEGTPEIASGALMRYLAEAPWFPTAFLPGQGVVWTSLPEGWSRATLSVGTTTVSVDFEFGADGLITQCRALRENDKLRQKVWWGGRYRDWVDRDGMKIPRAAEVYWELPTGTFPYWRGEVEPHYDFR